VTKDFDAEIAACGAEAEQAKVEMGAALERWLDVAAPWVAGFWERSIPRFVKENPDTVKALGEAGVKSLKAEADRLIGNARVHLQRRLVDDRPDHWPHLKPQTEPYDEDFRSSSSLHDAYKPEVYTPPRGGEPRQSLPDLVTIPLNRVLADIAPIFASKGFKIDGFKEEYSSGWELFRRSPGDWSNEMLETMTVYAEQHIRLRDALKSRDDLLREKAETEAADLWEQA
jgi:hypothetical protein